MRASTAMFPLRMSRWPWLLLGAIIVAAVIIPLLAGEQIADFGAALQPPGAGHLAGTDHSGYDLLVRTA